MCLDFPQLLRHGIQVIAMLLMGYSNVTAANELAQALPKPQIEVTVSDKSNELQLDARQMTLAKVLQSLTSKTHVPIHFSALPEGLVKEKCVGEELKKILECLLGQKADIIARYPHSNSKASGKWQKSG